MCVFALNQTKLWVIIFIIIKQCPMGIPRIRMYRQNRILIGNRILLRNTLVLFRMSDTIIVKYLYQLTDTCGSVCFHIFNNFIDTFSCNHGNASLSTCKASRLYNQFHISSLHQFRFIGQINCPHNPIIPHIPAFFNHFSNQIPIGTTSSISASRLGLEIPINCL
nr:MAG TPA: hypothetical protein [Caudoviricetes sp.]